MRVAIFVSLTLLAGAALAGLSISLVLPLGWIGAAGLIGWAMIARRRWSRAGDESGYEPALPEQVVWLRTAGTGLLIGHLATALLNPAVDLHVGSGNYLAIDSWTMTLAMLLGAVLFRHDRRLRDERHEQIAARGVRAGYACLLATVFVFLMYLAFAPPNLRGALTHWVIGNILTALMMLSYLAMLLAQLVLYRSEKAFAFQAGRAAR